jgi:nicotinate-nucleotide pyrophosphorylase (carboxylating)
MNRKALLKSGFNGSEKLTMKNPEYRNFFKNFIFGLLRSDLGKEDITTNSLIRKDQKANAFIISKESGILAGIEEFVWFYEQNGMKVKRMKEDGEHVRRNEKILEIYGSLKKILCLERVGLNLLQRMSGIASLTKELVERAKKANPNISVAATRKTPWGLLDKKSVFLGGGLTHRLNLSEAILIKDNHLESLRKGTKNPIDLSIERVWKIRNSNFIEIEVKDKEQALRSAKKFKEMQTSKRRTCVIMLDNIKPKRIKQIISELKKRNLYDFVLLEASGGINPTNISEYAKSGVDVLSLGYLTHSPRALNISEIIR